MAIGTPSATTLGGKKHHSRHSLKITESLEKNNNNKKTRNFANCFLQRLQLLVVIYPSFFCNYAISKSWPQNNNRKVMQTLEISNLITCSILWVFVVVVLEIPEVMAVSQSSYKVKAWCFLAGKKLIWFRPNGTQKPRKKPFWRWWKLAYEMLKKTWRKKIQTVFDFSHGVNLCENPPLQQTTTNNQQRKSANQNSKSSTKKCPLNRDLPLAICQRFIWQMHQHLGKTPRWLVEKSLGILEVLEGAPKKRLPCGSFLNLIFLRCHWDFNDLWWFMVYADVWR